MDDEVSIQLHNNGNKDETFYISLLDEDIHLNPAEIAYLTVFLASNKSWSVTGEVITATGGSGNAVYY